MEVAPLPKSQKYEVILPLDWFIKFTTNGEHPDVASAVKLAVWAKDTAAYNRGKIKMVVFLINVLSFLASPAVF